MIGVDQLPVSSARHQRPVCWTKAHAQQQLKVLPKSELSQVWFWSHFVVLLKSDLDVQQTRLSFINMCMCSFFVQKTKSCFKRTISLCFFVRKLCWVNFSLSMVWVKQSLKLFCAANCDLRISTSTIFIQKVDEMNTRANVIRLFTAVSYDFS